MTSGDTVFSGLQRGIELNNVGFAYDNKPALQDVTATIAAGKLTAIVGRTGSGKTTLTDLIARLYDGATGNITFDDTALPQLDLRTLHAKTSIVRQDVHLLDRDIRRNLTFGLQRASDDAELWQVLDDVDLKSAVERMADGLSTPIGEGGLKLSGGERQRLAIARALLRRPALLILDEATSALDSATESRVLRSISERAANSTVIAIAHRLSTIRDADHVLVLDEGRVVQAGSWADLAARDGQFKEMLAAQQRSG